MLSSLLDLLVVLQSGVQDGSSAGAAPVAGGAGQAAQSSPGGGMLNILLPVAMFAFLYFVMIRPQQKRQRETDAMLKALSKGQVVRTTGGIRGEIADLTDREATLIIADKVKINVLRSAIAGPDQVPTAAGAKSAEKGN